MLDTHHDPEHIGSFGGFKNVDENGIGQERDGGSKKNYVEIILSASPFFSNRGDGF